MRTVREAGRQDLGVVASLWQGCGLTPVTEAEWHALLDGPTTAVFVAEVDGALAGAAVAAFDGWRSYIYHVGVEPEFRRQGIAKALMTTAEREMSAAGARRFYVMVSEENTAGLALAAELGYLPEGEIALVKEAARGAERGASEDQHPAAGNGSRKRIDAPLDVGDEDEFVHPGDDGGAEIDELIAYA